MKPIRIAINGFGRIGRGLLRSIFQSTDNSSIIEVVAINDLGDTPILAHLLKYDSVHGRFNATVEIEKDNIKINQQEIKVFHEKDPLTLPWKEFDIDIVIESTGLFLTKELAGKHLKAGAKKVILSAPPKEDSIKTVVMGINDAIINKTDTIISNASCTTNCAAPMVKVLDENWELKEASITTVHSYTSDQRLHDAPHKDFRRARAAALSIIPTSTGAAKAITKIFPHLEGKISGCGMRVPVPNGSLTDITCVLLKTPTKGEINLAFKKAAEKELKGIMEYTTEPLVSIDIVGNFHSCIFDSDFTSVVGNMVKVIGWYDNEIGYSNRLIDLIKRINNPA